VVEFESDCALIDTVFDSDEGDAVAVSDPFSVTVTVFAPASESEELDSASFDLADCLHVYSAYPPTATKINASVMPRKHFKPLREESGGVSE